MYYEKVFILLVLCVLAPVSYAAVQIAQFIITECGTMYQIPSDSTEKEACEYLDFLTARDCG